MKMRRQRTGTRSQSMIASNSAGKEIRAHAVDATIGPLDLTSRVVLTHAERKHLRAARVREHLREHAPHVARGLRLEVIAAARWPKLRTARSSACTTSSISRRVTSAHGLRADGWRDPFVESPAIVRGGR